MGQYRLQEYQCIMSKVSQYDDIYHCLNVLEVLAYRLLANWKQWDNFLRYKSMTIYHHYDAIVQKVFLRCKMSISKFYPLQ